jgi:hypothetical protein
VTYTYTVTNNSDFFSWGGSLSDDTITLPAGAASFNLAPGETKSFGASGAVTGTVTNTATASGAFDDGSTTNASDTASAKVTGHVCRAIVKKVTLPSGESQPFSFNGDVIGSIADGGMLALDVLTPGTYSATETVPAGWDLTSITCDDSNSTGSATPVAPGGSGTATYNVAMDETVTCTFTNTRRGTIIVDKVTAPSSDPQVFPFGVGGDGIQTFNLDDDDPPNNQMLVPGSFSVIETAPSGWDGSVPSCTDPDGGTTSFHDPVMDVATASIDLDPGETVTCTFTNTRLATIKVTKVMLGGTGSFSFTGTPSGTISTDGGTIQANVVPGSYSSTEANQSGWELGGIVCDDGNSSGNVGAGTANFNAEAGETVNCTFTNTKLLPGRCPIGTICAVQDDSTLDSQIFKVDTLVAPPSVGDCGPFYEGANFEGLESWDGILYAASGETSDSFSTRPGGFYKVNADDCTLEFIGKTGFADVEALAVNPITGTLWGFGESQGLFTIRNLGPGGLNPGKGTLEIASSTKIEGMTWSIDGDTLYGVGDGNLRRFVCSAPVAGKLIGEPGWCTAGSWQFVRSIAGQDELEGLRQPRSGVFGRRGCVDHGEPRRSDSAYIRVSDGAFSDHPVTGAMTSGIAVCRTWGRAVLTAGSDNRGPAQSE